MPNEAVAIKRLYPGQVYSVREPQVKTILSATPNTTIFERGVGTTKDIGRIEIQNLGTGALLIALNQAAQTNSFHKLLAGGSASRDGLGSDYVIEPYMGVNKISVKALADTEIAITLFEKEY